MPFSIASLPLSIDLYSRSMGLFVVITENNSPASSTVLTIGPIVSKLLHNGTTPSIDTLPKVVFKPTKSFQAAGILTDPPVSEPIAAGARPKATDAAAPDEEPPATAPRSFTQGGV